MFQLSTVAFGTSAFSLLNARVLRHSTLFSCILAVLNSPTIFLRKGFSFFQQALFIPFEFGIAVPLPRILHQNEYPKNENPPHLHEKGIVYCRKNNLGMELLFQRATPKVSSPQTRFTAEFGMGSEWFHDAKHTKKWFSQEPSRLHKKEK